MPDRLTLAIEAANPAMPGSSVCLAEGTGQLARVLETEPVSASTRETDDLVAAIARLCGRVMISGRPAESRDIGRVAVSVGPGGYTAMRMAVATAKMIAEVAGARCIAVPSVCSIAAAAREQRPRGPFVVVMATKGDTAYVARFADDGRIESSGLMAAATLAAAGAGTGENPLNLAAMIADSHLPQAFAAWAREQQVAVIAASCDARSCLEAAEGFPELYPADLLPIYAREPEAVTLWRARHAGKSPPT